MRIGLTEFILILLIASLTIGPTVAVWVNQWMRRAQKSQAAAERRRKVAAAQRAAEREDLLHRFRKLALVIAAGFALVLAYTLLLRPIDAAPQAYTAPQAPEEIVATHVAKKADALDLGIYQNISCVRAQGDWLYFAAQTESGGQTLGALVRAHADGSGLAEVLTVEGEITGFAFDADETLWLTVADADGGALCRAGYDGWGAALERVVTQIDGQALGCPAAVEAGPDGKIYFADACAAHAKNGAEAALRTELMAHTGTGHIYVYDPAARTVECVLSGLAGASGLALAPDGQTLYVSDLGNRCVWAVSPAGRELTAGGRGCAAFADALPGYPGTLAFDEDGSLLIAYRWAYSAWLEDHADGTLLRGAALRTSMGFQEKLFRLPSDATAAEARAADGTVRAAFGGKRLGSIAAVCPVGNRVYVAVAGQGALRWVRV